MQRAVVGFLLGAVAGAAFVAFPYVVRPGLEFDFDRGLSPSASVLARLLPGGTNER